MIPDKPMALLIRILFRFFRKLKSGQTPQQAGGEAAAQMSLHFGITDKG